LAPTVSLKKVQRRAQKQFFLLLKTLKVMLQKRIYKNVNNKKKWRKFAVFTYDYRVGRLKTFLGKHFSPDLKQT
jgi:hypothetical protein